MNPDTRTVKINDPYPAYSGMAYSMKELMPDPEVVKDLSELTARIMRNGMVDDELWLRRVSAPLIADGYRLEELVFIIGADRFWRKGKPLRVLLPKKDLNPIKLWFRRQWRQFFPYRLPNGKLHSKIAIEPIETKK